MTRAAWVLVISGVVGFRVGIAGFPTWAIPVESAQVVAGIVRYPADNPFYIYHTKIWTLLIQISAVCLRAGVSEIALSRAISGILGMVSFQALAMLVYAVSQDALMSIGSAFVIFFSRITDAGVTYPVLLLDTHHTYGALGLSFVVLVLALFANGWYKSASFLLGISPAVHPSLALWGGLVAMAGLAWDHRDIRPHLRQTAIWFSAGALITAVSLALQLTVIAHSVRTDADVAANYFRTFVTIWDDHRRPVQLLRPGVIFNGGALVLALFWLNRFSDSLPRPALFLLRTVVVSAALGFAAIAFTWIPGDRQPEILSLLMPARILNYNVVVIGPLIVGVLTRWRDRFLSQLLLAMFLLALLLNERSFFEPHPLEPSLVVEWAIVFTVALAVLAPRRRAGATPAGPSLLSAKFARVCALIISMGAAALTLHASRPSRFYRDRTNDPFFAAVAAETRGLVLTAGSYQMVQLYTRRPVLLDGGGLDTLTYAPETGPAMRRILRDVYEVDFFNPPPWAKSSPVLPHDYVKQVWGRFSLEKWQEIGRVYGVTQVLARTDYWLRLPIAAEDQSFRLYRIPE